MRRESSLYGGLAADDLSRCVRVCFEESLLSEVSPCLAMAG